MGVVPELAARVHQAIEGIVCNMRSRNRRVVLLQRQQEK